MLYFSIVVTIMPDFYASMGEGDSSLVLGMTVAEGISGEEAAFRPKNPEKGK